MAAKLTVKVTFKSDIRRFAFDFQPTWQQLREKLCELFQMTPEELALKYKDDEGDFVTISSDLELLEALKVEGGNILRLYAYNKDSDEKADVTPLPIVKEEKPHVTFFDEESPSAVIDAHEAKINEVELRQKIEEQLRKFIETLEAQSRTLLEEARVLQFKFTTEIKKAHQEGYQEQIKFCKEQAQKCIAKIRELKEELKNVIKKAQLKMSSSSTNSFSQEEEPLAQRVVTSDEIPEEVKEVVPTEASLPMETIQEIEEVQEDDENEEERSGSSDDSEESSESSTDESSDSGEEEEEEQLEEVEEVEEVEEEEETPAELLQSSQRDETDSIIQEFEDSAVEISTHSEETEHLLKQLEDMGFVDREKNSMILSKNNMDLLETIRELVIV